MSRGFKIAIGTFGIVASAFVLLLLIAMAANEVPLLVTFGLAAGWVRYLTNVLPKVSINWAGLGLTVVCAVLAGILGHRFCRWLWRETGHEPAWRPRWTVAGLATIVLLFASGMAVTGIAHQTGWLLRSPEPVIVNTGGASNTRNASASLKTIVTAQLDFRSNDRDGNRVNDFWRGDIAGLYAIVPPGGSGPTDAIKLIEISIAAADDHPVVSMESHLRRAPKAGYWYRALRFKDEKKDDPDPDRFAACAYPDSMSSGRVMFIVSHRQTIYRKQITKIEPPELFPDDPEKEGWSRLD